MPTPVFYREGEESGFLGNREEPGAANVLRNSRETPVKRHKEIRPCSSDKVSQLITQLKCLDTNGHKVGNKQEEMEDTTQLESCNLIAITENWRSKCVVG